MNDDITDPREHLLRKVQAILTDYLKDPAKGDRETLGDIIEEMELAGYGSIEIVSGPD